MQERCLRRTQVSIQNCYNRLSVAKRKLCNSHPTVIRIQQKITKLERMQNMIRSSKQLQTL